MERLLDHVAGSRPGPVQFSRSGWEPAIDLLETKDAVIVTIELAGTRPQDIGIVVDHDTLTVNSQRRKHSAPVGGGVYHVMEIASGPFARTVTLPAPVDPDQAKASWENGLVQILMPKVRIARSGVLRLEIR
jgi:HSP20 family protein